MNEANPVIEDFLADLKSSGRSNPKEWLQFYEFLKMKKGPGQENPPVPLILAASNESKATKHWRLSQQLIWAHESGCLDDVLLYLKKIPIEKWESCTPSRWNVDSW